MKLFHPDTQNKSSAHQKLAARIEVICTIIDFLAAVFFIIGSILFFSEAWVTFGIWMFVIGSTFFALSPTMKVLRELKCLKMEDYAPLAGTE